jgi:4-hydroxy-tetrahydrodipicolinate synthase
LVVENALRVEALGVDGVLATTPYYNKPTQAGLIAHFSAIAEAIKLEVCLYDVPGRTITNIEPKTVAELAQLENITAIKDATGDMANAMEIMRLCGDRVNLLSGDDFTTLPFLAQGGDGVISVASNVVPNEMKRLVDASKGGRLKEAQELTKKLFPLFSALFAQSNPMPVKAAMAMMGLMSEEIRLPLTEVSDDVRASMGSALSGLGLAGR